MSVWPPPDHRSNIFSRLPTSPLFAPHPSATAIAAVDTASSVAKLAAAAAVAAPAAAAASTAAAPSAVRSLDHARLLPTPPSAELAPPIRRHPRRIPAKTRRAPFEPRPELGPPLKRTPEVSARILRGSDTSTVPQNTVNNTIHIVLVVLRVEDHQGHAAFYVPFGRKD